MSVATSNQAGPGSDSQLACCPEGTHQLTQWLSKCARPALPHSPESMAAFSRPWAPNL